MCWIVWLFGESEEPNKERAIKSLEKVIHRGSSNFEIKNLWNGVVIWANRLPIQWRSNGFQPISNEDKTIWACQNWEIFNYTDLRKQLEALGHIFTTDCDTELRVHLYEEYGTNAVNYVDSEMFACILYDTQKDQIYVCRDELWVKPLYYATHKDWALHFVSEMKQLAQFDDVLEINEFPQWHYYCNGVFSQYSTINTHVQMEEITDETQAINSLTEALIQAVKKRVNTDLPIGVFLSWGVDSSLIMEIATRFHPDVTAIILWNTGAPDYEYALKLCNERKYKYHVINPDHDYRQKIDEMIYFAETYEPLIIRHAFANDFCSKVAQQLWLKIVLVGEGADELFAWYNEFSYLSDTTITEGILKLTNDLSKGHLKRVDRLAMRYTVEPRCPFLDKDVISTAFRIINSLKVKKINHNIFVKYILRKVAEQFLPNYIAFRYKMPFANGAGMWVGNNYKKDDGEVANYINKQGDFLSQISNTIKDQYSISTNYEAYHLLEYTKNNFNKLVTSDQRIVVKDLLHTLEKKSSNLTKLLVAEFDYIPLYFPVYYAQKLNLYKQHNLEVNFMSTKWDYETYFSLVNGTAQIGLSDPLFTMMTQDTGIAGEMIGELVNKNPLVAITLNPKVSIITKEDLKNYRIGSYRNFTTSHTFASYFVGIPTQPYEKTEIATALTNREIDIAIILLEDALEIERLGGEIVYSFIEEFNRFCFTGLTTTNITSNEGKITNKGFINAIQESLRYIRKNKEKALSDFSMMFSSIKNPEILFEWYVSCWKEHLVPDEYDTRKSYEIWKWVYPTLMQKFSWEFFRKDEIDTIIGVFTGKKYKKDHPFLEEKLYEVIKNSKQKHISIPICMFWWASDKKQYDKSDIATLNYLEELNTAIKTVYPPGCKFTIILADEHAINNGYSKNTIQKYHTSLLPQFEKRAMQYVLLSTIYKKYSFKRDEQITLYEQSQPNHRWEDVSIREELENTAQKNYKWKDFIQGAKKYYILRTLEKKMLEDYFSDNIFMTYSNSSSQLVFPYLPTLYIFTEKKWYSELPWFKI